VEREKKSSEYHAPSATFLEVSTLLPQREGVREGDKGAHDPLLHLSYSLSIFMMYVTALNCEGGGEGEAHRKGNAVDVCLFPTSAIPAGVLPLASSLSRIGWFYICVCVYGWVSVAVFFLMLCVVGAAAAA
jgi:hypothetical protein